MHPGQRCFRPRPPNTLRLSMSSGSMPMLIRSSGVSSACVDRGSVNGVLACRSKMSSAMGTRDRSILTLLLLLLLPSDAHAQENSARQGGKKPSAWIKLCEKRRPPQETGVCMTLHERVDGQTGEVLISAALRQTEGEDKEYFRVMLPRGLVEQHVHAAIFPEQMWEKKIRDWLQKNEKLERKSDEPNLQTFSL